MWQAYRVLADTGVDTQPVLSKRWTPRMPASGSMSTFVV